MGGKGKRIFLSAPHANLEDREAVLQTLDQGWIAPVGPELAAFEREAAIRLGVSHSVALSSGTAALHLGLKFLGVKPGDYVLIPTATFGATAFAVTYLGAIPVFIDIDSSWTMDPDCVSMAANSLRAAGKSITAAIPVDLYGTPADYSVLIPLFSELEIPVLEDAAEGLGAEHVLGPVGSFGSAGILSFNGNKIITTSGGGMLVTNLPEMADKVRFWATQARESTPWYEHSEIGYNYRLSNILAALGRSQLSRLDSIVQKRRQVREWYRLAFSAFGGVRVQSDPPWGKSNAWLTVVTFDTDLYPDVSRVVREALEAVNIESRPVWKPMHQQPVFAGNPTFLNGSADALFASGLCLPSGTDVSETEIQRVAEVVNSVLRRFS